MSRSHRHGRLAGIGLTLAIGLAACSGAGAASTPSAATSTAASSAATSTTTVSTTTVSSASSSEASAAATTKVNANTATVEELQAAFEAVGISNADRWAREVAEYRPYPSDPTWAQLRQELGKYNIDPAVLEEIIAVLEV